MIWTFQIISFIYVYKKGFPGKKEEGPVANGNTLLFCNKGQQFLRDALPYHVQHTSFSYLKHHLYHICIIYGYVSITTISITIILDAIKGRSWKARHRLRVAVGCCCSFNGIICEYHDREKLNVMKLYTLFYSRVVFNYNALTAILFVMEGNP